MTEKLYDLDAYLRSFTAEVLACTPIGQDYEVILNATAFFPEEGGQSADTGRLGGAAVRDVRIKDGVIRHITDSPLPVGSTVAGEIDFAPRFEKMQCHTAEHILSGLFHSLYGIENVGFHLGEREVTLDTSAPVTPEMLAEVEERANRAIWENRPVTCRYPSPEELSSMSYRSKIEIQGAVRIVEIEGIDVCACCAPHVRRTGEIGIVKCISAEKHKSGTRITMLAGSRAYRYLCDVFSAAHTVAVSLSCGNTDLPGAVASLKAEAAQIRNEASSLVRRLAEEQAKALPETPGSLAVLLDDSATADAMLAYANAAIGKVGGVLGVFLPQKDALRYLLMIREGDITPVVRAFNKALSARGGGKGNLAQGTVPATFAEVEAYFASL